MPVCTFFGHRIVPKEIEPTLRSTLINLIINHNVKLFYVGNHGDFDAMARRTLKSLSDDYPITYYIVLAYMPEKRASLCSGDLSDTIFPDGVETVPKRFAITYRNKWMLDRSDFVVTYVVHGAASGSAQFKKMAERKGKTVIGITIG